MVTKSKTPDSVTADTLVAFRNELLDPKKGFVKWCIYFLDGPPDHDEFWSQKCHEPLCDHLTSPLSPDKLVVLPRGHLKTTIAAILYPLWRATCNPNLRCVIISNTEPNARNKLEAIRGFVESKAYRMLFPDRVPDLSARNARWSNSAACLRRETVYPEATFEAAGTGTNLTGRHYDLVVEDDTVAPRRDSLTGNEIMPTRDDIEKAIKFHILTLPLLIDFNTGQRIYIGTRWAFNDCINYIKEKELQEQGGRYFMLDMPAVDENGQALYHRFGLKTLGHLRANLGEWLFASLYLNTPLESAQLRFRPEWVRYYEEYQLPKEGNTFITVDPADPPTGKENQCFWVSLSARHTPQGIFVRRYCRGHFSEAEGIRETLDMADEDGALRIRVEADRYANLAAGFRTEMTKRGKHYIIEEVKTRGRNKEARIMRLTPLFENGVIFIKRNMAEIENELYQFPHGATNDIIDALAWHILDDFSVDDLAPAQLDQKSERAVGTVTFDDIMDTMRQHRDWRSMFSDQFPESIHVRRGTE